MSGYARGAEEYSSLPTAHESDENDNNEDGDDIEPEDYDNERCTDDQFTCKNLQCINLDQRCDGTRHCNDGSDELNCTFNKPSGD